MSYSVMPYRVTLSRVISCHVKLRYVMFRRVITCHVVSCQRDVPVQWISLKYVIKWSLETGGLQFDKGGLSKIGLNEVEDLPYKYDASV